MAQLQMVRPRAEPVSASSGATVRAAVGDDADQLAVLLTRAFPESPWDAAKVRRELLDAADVEQTYVVARDGAIVATASARDHGKYPGEGYVHWVAVAPEARGGGLFEAVMGAVLAGFAASGRPAMLETDDPRLPAIGAYLRLGFVPRYVEADHPARWSKVFMALAAARHAKSGRK